MTIDRRGFLYAGGFATAAAGSLVTAAHAAPAPTFANVADFGVQPDTGGDQTAALQKALDELAGRGKPILLPAGAYVTGPLTLPRACTLIGTPGLTILRAKASGPVLAGEKTGTFHLSGVSFEGAASKGSSALLSVSGSAVSITHCRFYGTSAMALSLDGCSGAVQSVEIAGSMGVGVSALRSAGISISDCRIAACQAEGIAVSGSGQDVAGFTVNQNHLASCGTGIAADGSGIVTGNTVTGSSRFGLKLGSGRGEGHILAQSNLLRGCRIGIGVSASGDDIMASLNLITGAKDGFIRAFDGDKLVGPDLARQSAEAFLNLMVAGNVAR